MHTLESQPTIYIVGGLPRTGKTTLADRLAGTLAVGGMETDHIRVLFEPTLTSKIRFGSNAPIEKVTKKLRPRLECLVKAFVEQDISFVISGECIDPRMVASSPYRHQIKSCFLGLNDPERAMARMREVNASNDWTNEKSDEDLTAILAKYAVRSQLLQQTTAELGLPYFDASHNFLQVHQQAFELLVGTEEEIVT